MSHVISHVTQKIRCLSQLGTFATREVCTLNVCLKIPDTLSEAWDLPRPQHPPSNMRPAWHGLTVRLGFNRARTNGLTSCQSVRGGPAKRHHGSGNMGCPYTFAHAAVRASQLWTMTMTHSNEVSTNLSNLALRTRMGGHDP